MLVTLLNNVEIEALAADERVWDKVSVGACFSARSGPHLVNRPPDKTRNSLHEGPKGKQASVYVCVRSSQFTQGSLICGDFGLKAHTAHEPFVGSVYVVSLCSSTHGKFGGIFWRGKEMPPACPSFLLTLPASHPHVFFLSQGLTFCLNNNGAGFPTNSLDSEILIQLRS